MSLISDANLLYNPTATAAAAASSSVEEANSASLAAYERTLNSTLRKPCKPVGPCMVTRLIRAKDYNSYSLWLEDYTGQNMIMLAAAQRINQYELKMISYSMINKAEWTIGTIKREDRRRGVAYFHTGVRFMSMDKTGNRMQLKMIKHLKLGPSEEDPSIVLTNKQGYKQGSRSTRYLHFDPRVAEASPRNCQLIHPKDEDLVLLEFGKMRENEYSLQWNYPFCGIQAFAFALLQMEVKW